MSNVAQARHPVRALGSDQTGRGAINSIYEELGGVDGVRTAVTIMYRRVLDDPALAPWFDGVDLDRLQAHQRAFLAAAFGGPQVFSGLDAATAHRDLAITDDAFTRVASSLLTALADLGVAKEAITAVGERLETLRPAVVTA